MKRTIITTGYMGSGSSAITDLMAEYQNFKNDFASFEYVLLHCPNGLFDLEDKLLRGNNAIRSDEAIREFRHTMKQLYDKKYWWVGHYNQIIGPEFMKITDEFISEITQFQFDGYWYYHENADFKMIRKLMVQKALKVLFGKWHHFPKITKYDGRMNISYITSDEFYKAAKKYIKNILEYVRKGANNIVLDQFLLPFNLWRFENYFDDDTYVFVVERDPRDVFVLNKYIWPQKGIPVPMPLEVYEFCKFYKGLRTMEGQVTSKMVKRVKFEDLVYRYDDMVKEIEAFIHCGDTDHVNKLKRFNPELSIKNTQVFRDEKYKDEIEVIEKELSEYLYDFPYELDNNVNNSIEFD